MRLSGTANLAGSALTPINAIRHAAVMLRCDWQDIWKYYSTNPANFMNLPAAFEPGAPAEFIEIETDSPNRIVSTQLHRP